MSAPGMKRFLIAALGTWFRSGSTVMMPRSCRLRRAAPRSRSGSPRVEKFRDSIVADWDRILNRSDTEARMAVSRTCHLSQKFAPVRNVVRLSPRVAGSIGVMMAREMTRAEKVGHRRLMLRSWDLLWRALNASSRHQRHCAAM
jgi:hypothetical protein